MLDCPISPIRLTLQLYPAVSPKNHKPTCIYDLARYTAPGGGGLYI